MFNLVNKVRQGETADRAKMIAGYRAILEAGDGATSEQVTELRRLMASLGYDSAKMEADARAVANRKVASELAAKLEQREIAYRDDHHRHAKLCDETEAAIKELQAKLQRSLAQVHELERVLGASRAGVRNLSELERRHWELFGIAEPENSHRPFGPGNP